MSKTHKMFSVLELLQAYDEINQRKLHFQGAIRINKQVIHNWKQPIAIKPRTRIQLGKNDSIIITQEIITHATTSRNNSNK